MLGPEASAALTVALVPVVLWCALCLVGRARHGAVDPVPADVAAWHCGMGVLMVLALWMPVSPAWAWAGMSLILAMASWSLLRGRAASGRYLQLGVMAAAMVAMLLPAAASADTGGMAMGGASAAASVPSAHHGPTMLLSGVGAVVVAVAMVGIGLPALRVAGSPGPVRERLSACCDVVMAASMAVMALAMV